MANQANAIRAGKSKGGYRTALYRMPGAGPSAARSSACRTAHRSPTPSGS
jgi:hypothetical protein